MKRQLPAIIALAALLVDRVCKFFVLNGTDVHVDPLHFTLFKNTGLVFSLPVPYLVSVMLMLAAFMILIVILWRGRHQPWLRWPLALLIAGASSNLYDRLIHGFIIDYGFFATWLPIVNISDLMLTVAVVMLLVHRTPVDTRPKT